jgi:flagellar protein FliO/FliZ
MRGATAATTAIPVLAGWSGCACAAAPDGVAIGRTLLSLALVVALILVLGLLLRGRTALRGQCSGRHLTVKAQLAVGIRERVIVLRVGDEDILVGVGTSGVRMLHVLARALPDDVPVAGDSGSFARRLSAMFGGEGGRR